jgi:uridylate kinase
MVVYDKDPRKHPDAVKQDRLSFGDLERILEHNVHHAGIHQIIDPVAMQVLKRKRLRLVVVNGYKPENIVAAIQRRKRRHSHKLKSPASLD